MVILLSSDELLGKRVSSVLEGTAVACVDTREAFLRAAEDADVLLIDLDMKDLTHEWLRETTVRSLSAPVISLVREITPRRDLIAAGSFQALLRTEELPQLPLEIRKAASRTYMARTAARLQAADILPPRLGRAMTKVLCRRRPFPSVEALAQAVNADPSTLHDEFRGVVGDANLTLKTVLDWIFLLRARALKTPYRSWASVAGELGRPLRSLRRACRRRLDRTLSQLEAEALEEMLEKFAARVVDPLLP